MGIFDWLRRRDPVEVRLEREHLEAMVPLGIPRSMAQKQFNLILDMAKENLVKDGADQVPARFGDLVLDGQESFSNELCTRLAHALRASFQEMVDDGMTEEDFRWWWNLPPLERAFLMAGDHAFVIETLSSAYDECIQADDSDERARFAWSVVAKRWPIYRSSTARPNELEGDDRLLPTEMKNRVNLGRSRLLPNRESLVAVELQYSSFNAWVREQVRRGAV